MHGKTSQVSHDGKTIFGGLPTPMTATRYHSLIVEEKSLPSELEVSAYTTERDGTRTIMGLRHRKFPVEGVQFHPESVLTEEGKKLVENFLQDVRKFQVAEEDIGKGTTSVVPLTDQYRRLQPLRWAVSNSEASGAKAPTEVSRYGTTKVVPFPYATE